MGEFASKGVAGAGLGTGIAGLSLGVLNGAGNGGILGNLLGGRNMCGDMLIMEELAKRDSEIAFYKSKNYSDENDLAVYKYFDGRFRELENRMHEHEVQQSVFNANVTTGMSTLGLQVKALEGVIATITKTAIPCTAVCDFTSRCSAATTTTTTTPTT
jgi:hypothetical protein